MIQRVMSLCGLVRRRAVTRACCELTTSERFNQTKSKEMWKVACERTVVHLTPIRRFDLFDEIIVKNIVLGFSRALRTETRVARPQDCRALRVERVNGLRVAPASQIGIVVA